MVKYFPYDTQNPQEVTGERHTISNGMIRLRHVPLEHSIKISGFTEVASPAALHLNEFACLYSRETGYRESNRIVYFSNAHNAATILVDYFAVGTVVTADDMNEIKQHIDAESAKDSLNENEHVQFANDILALQRAVATISAGVGYELPTASASIKGGVKIGAGLSMADDTLNVKAFTLGTTPLTVEGGMWLSVDGG